MNEESMNRQEILGAISGRVVHALSNYISALSGNLIVATMSGVSEEQRSAALGGVKEATRRSAELLDQFGDLTRSMDAETARSSLGEAVGNLRKSWTDWDIRVAPQFERSALCLAGPWKWLQFGLEAVAGEYGGRAGSVFLEPAQSSRTVRPIRNFIAKQYLSIELRAPGAAPIQWEEHRGSLRNWKLTAAYELFAQLGGRPETITMHAGIQRTNIILPLAEK
jgi:hypothetical protein